MWHIIIKVVDYSKRFFLLEMFFFSRFWLGFIFVRLAIGQYYGGGRFYEPAVVVDEVMGNPIKSENKF